MLFLLLYVILYIRIKLKLFPILQCLENTISTIPIINVRVLDLFSYGSGENNVKIIGLLTDIIYTLILRKGLIRHHLRQVTKITVTKFLGIIFEKSKTLQ